MVWDFQASEDLATFQINLDEALDAGDLASIRGLLSERAVLESGTFQDLDTAEDVGDFLGQLDYVAERLRHDDVEGLDHPAIAERLNLLCLAQLITASVVSTGRLLTAELINVAVKSGYRSISWGLAAAEQLADGQEPFAVRSALADLLHGPGRLRRFEELLSRDLPAMSADDQCEATELLAAALPAELLPQLTRQVDQFSRDHLGGYPRSLAAIAAVSDEPKRSELADKALRAARSRPNTWGHAMTLLRLLPLVPVDQRRARWSEFVDAAFDGIGIPNETRLAELLPLADLDFVRPLFFPRMVIAAARTDQDDAGRLSPDQRDELLADYAGRLAKNRRVVDAFRVVNLIPAGQGRLDALESVMEGVGRWLYFAVLRLPAPAQSLGQSVGRVLRASLIRIGPRGRYRLRRRLLDMAMAADDDSRQEMIWGLIPYLPDDLAQRARSELREVLANVDTADPSGRRQVINGLVNLADVSPAADRQELLSCAFGLITIDDEDGRRSLAGECRHLAMRRLMPDRDSLLDAMDPSAAGDGGTGPSFDAARLPAELLPLAWEAAWAWRPHHFGQFGAIVGRMAELGLADAAYSQLERLIPRVSRQALAELLDGLPDFLITARLSECLLTRWQQAEDSEKGAEDFAQDLSAITKMTGQLPDDVARAIVEWHRTARPWQDTREASWEDISAWLAPLYAQAGYLEEAMDMAAVMAADHEKAQALAGIARYLPDSDRLSTAREALRLARITGNDRVQTDYRRRFAEALVRLPGATRFTDIVADSADARTLAVIASVLPPDEAPEVWKEAIREMSESELADFVSLMPEDLANDAISAVARGSGDDYFARRAMIVRQIFARLEATTSQSAQFDRLADFIAESAQLGRPVLLRNLRVVAPLLSHLGDDTVLTLLPETVDQVTGWWP